MRQAAPGPIDCVLDLLPPAASATAVRAAAMAVRPYGRVVLMGGVGMQGGSGLELPYPWIMRNCISIRGQCRALQDDGHPAMIGSRFGFCRRSAAGGLAGGGGRSYHQL